MKICCALSAFILFLNQIYAQGVLVSTENPEMLENAEHEIKHDAITFKNATLNQKNNQRKEIERQNIFTMLLCDK